MGRSSFDPHWQAVHEDGSAFPGETHPTMVALHTGEAQKNIVMGVHKPSGELTWILINAQPVYRPNQREPYAVISSFTDITALKEAEVKLQYAAVHDTLTGLPLRPLLTDRLAHALAHLGRDPTYGIAVLFIDLDGFKAVNDALGHEAGDDLLKTVAGKLTRGVREEDTVARLGGDEFVVLLEGFGRQTDALVLIDRLLEMLSFGVVHKDGSLPVSASIGVTFPDGRSSATDVIRDADVAMYRAKAAGKARYWVEPGDPSEYE
jgi:diguanylate cyclase (GGDEF)-like protein